MGVEFDRKPRTVPERSAPSLDDRVVRRAPQNVWVVHHEVKEKWDEKSQDICTVADLPAVDRTPPGGSTVKNLIAQHVKPVKQNAENLDSVAIRHCPLRDLFAGFKPLRPVFISGKPVVMAPEGLKYEFVL